ncbi:hypothetical protein TH53_00395 [Pedobacter lusitanus]|uniref:Uncharacterized protein n=1 Tax=Pedobacter lusitanus TaxID=1503925 RepID=A0A0D0G2H7_9SPHI|nr:hypothetical protein [Pedobacter lusitanus]KIO78984.1 hypothetical protein TH53_00395 [Pedobacter lusitanus]
MKKKTLLVVTTIIVVFGAQLKAQTAPLNSKPVSVNLNLSDVIGSSAASTSSIVSFNYSSIVDIILIRKSRSQPTLQSQALCPTL